MNNQTPETQLAINEAIKAERARIIAALQEVQENASEDYMHQTLWIALHEVECVVNNEDLTALRNHHFETISALHNDHNMTPPTREAWV